MKIVIDIPEKNKALLDSGEADGSVRKSILLAVSNGTPLQKNHGRLIDADEILRELGSYHIGGIDVIKNYNGENTWEDGLHTAWRVIDDAETIIPAESEEEE